LVFRNEKILLRSLSKLFERPDILGEKKLENSTVFGARKSSISKQMVKKALIIEGI
jgi:hypothetical protein